MDNWIVTLAGLGIILLFNSVVIEVLEKPLMQLFKKTWLAHIGLILGEATIFIVVILLFDEFL